MRPALIRRRLGAISRIQRLYLNALIQRLQGILNGNSWKQFHSPTNLAVATNGNLDGSGWRLCH
ncbi:hypothetical protein HX866_33205 [Pseudomonas gingeri]|uniref:hypothetical protein n=1 Tax=Pseudomonas gingeri TaxID=117681 RepID=UPI0015A29151|nr:hypothetical protein [Pseudomonas gingeri]NWA29743.1 hypothetical protein [Pseudomonas gingeri]